MAVRVHMPLPSVDFDPSERAIPWQALSATGHDVLFATPHGRPARAVELVRRLDAASGRSDARERAGAA